MFERKNTQSRNVVICIVILLLGILMIFAPSIFGIDMMDGGGALILLGFFVSLSAFFVSFIFVRRKQVLDRMYREEGTLARWTYGQAQWDDYNEKEFAYRKSYNRSLLIFIAVICLVVGSIFLVADLDGGGPVVFAVLTGIVPVLGFTAWLMPRHYYNKNKNSAGDVIISPEGVYLSGELHVWTGYRCRLERVQFFSENRMLEFRYYTPARYGKQLNVFHVPVPAGKEQEAMEIISYFKSSRLYTPHFSSK